MNAGTMYKIQTVVKADPTYGDGMQVRIDDIRYVRVDSELQLSELLARIDLAVNGVAVKPK